MRKALKRRFFETSTDGDIVDLDKECGQEDDVGSSEVLANAIHDVCGGSSTVGKVMRGVQAHVKDGGGICMPAITQKLGPLIGLCKFHPSIIRWCLMHVLHLGILYTVNGGTMHVLLSAGIWGDAHESVQTRLHRAYIQFKSWCATHKISCSQPAFQEKQLYQRNGDVTMVCKAYNGRIVMQWLADTAAETVQQNLPGVDDRLAPIALCMLHLARFMLNIEKAGRFLTQEESTSIFHDGREFIRLYLRLADVSVRRGLQEWFVKPKVHALWHILRSVRDKRSNPRFWHCFVDEDAMSWTKSTYLKAHPTRRTMWVTKCGRLRIWATKLKVRRMNKEVAARLASGRG